MGLRCRSRRKEGNKANCPLSTVASSPSTLTHPIRSLLSLSPTPDTHLPPTISSGGGPVGSERTAIHLPKFTSGLTESHPPQR